MTSRYPTTALLLVNIILLLIASGVHMIVGVSATIGVDGTGTPLHWAAWNQDLDGIRKLIRRGTDVNVEDTSDGTTALHWAAVNGHDSVVDLLLGQDANVNAQTRGWRITPLHLAAREGRMEVVRVLCRYGAAVNTKTKDGRTPLHLAAREGHYGIAKYLIREKKANVDAATKDGRTPLLLAAREGRAELVSLLVEEGAAVQQTTRDGRTALHLAAREGHSHLFTLLVSEKVHVDVGTKHEGETPLHWAAQNGKGDSVTTLISMGADKYARAQDGWNPLHWACWDGHEDAARALLLLPHSYTTGDTAYIDVPIDDGRTPLDLAAWNGHKDVVQLLLKAGAVGMRRHPTLPAGSSTTTTVHSQASSSDLPNSFGVYLLTSFTTLVLGGIILMLCHIRKLQSKLQLQESLRREPGKEKVESKPKEARLPRNGGRWPTPIANWDCSGENPSRVPSVCYDDDSSQSQVDDGTSDGLSPSNTTEDPPTIDTLNGVQHAGKQMAEKGKEWTPDGTNSRDE